MKQYEYKTEFYNAKEKGMFSIGVDMSGLERKLNELGSIGWELCTTLPEPMGPQQVILIFKREMSS